MSMPRLASVAAAIDALSEWTGRAVAWLALAMVLVTTLVVGLRYLFSIGFVWMQESVVWMHALVFMLGAAYTLKRDEHVRVDVYYRGMDARRRAIVDLAGTLLLLLPTCAFLLFSGLGYAGKSWQIHEASREAGGLPGVFLLKSVIPLAALLIGLQGIAAGLRAVMTLLDHGEARPPERTTRP